MSHTEHHFGDVDLLAGIAWRGYLKHGRGVVFVDRTKAVSKTKLSIDKGFEELEAPAGYLPAGSVYLVGDVAISQMVDDYKPDSEMIIAYRYTEKSVRFIRFEVDVKAAYERRALELGEKSARCN